MGREGRPGRAIRADSSLQAPAVGDLVGGLEVLKDGFDDDELFHIDGKTYAFSNQWGDRTSLRSQIVDASLLSTRSARKCTRPGRCLARLEPGYRARSADCLYVPGITDAETIGFLP